MNATIQQLVGEIVRLGDDDKERAVALGVSPRTITEYKAGRFPRIITALLEKNILVLGNGMAKAVGTEKGTNQ